MRIACVIDDGFEDSEYTEPAAALREAGHEVLLVGLKAAKEIHGKRGNAIAVIDRAIEEVKPEDFDALFIPGGYSPDHLRANQAMVDFSRGFVTGDKPVLAICHGPQLLLTADVVRGRKMTAYKTIQVDLRYAGADVVDEEVVVDGKLVTSRHPGDVPAFVRESLAVLAREPAQVR
jgi:protease I